MLIIIFNNKKQELIKKVNKMTRNTKINKKKNIYYYNQQMNMTMI